MRGEVAGPLLGVVERPAVLGEVEVLDAEAAAVVELRRGGRAPRRSRRRRSGRRRAPACARACPGAAARGRRARAARTGRRPSRRRDRCRRAAAAPGTSARNARTVSAEFTTAPAHGSSSAPRRGAPPAHRAFPHAVGPRSARASCTTPAAASGTRSGSRSAARATSGSVPSSGSMCSKPSACAASARGRRRRRAARRRRRRRRAASAARHASTSASTSASPCRPCCRCWPRVLSKSSRDLRRASSRRRATSTRSASGCWKSVYAYSVRPRICPFTCAACSDARNATSGAFSAGFSSGGGSVPDFSNSAAVMRVAPDGRDRVHGDAVPAELERPHERHAHDPGLGRAVVGLAEVAAQPGRRRDVDDAAVALLLHHRRRVARAVERALQVHARSTASKSVSSIFSSDLSRTMPALFTRMSTVPNASTAVCTMRRRAVEVGDRVVVRHGRAAERLDLLAHLRGGIVVGAAPVERDADVVDDDLARPRARSTARTRGRCRGRNR